MSEAIEAILTPAAPAHSSGFKPGDAVVYVPDHCHHLDRDHHGHHLWHFEHTLDTPARQVKQPGAEPQVIPAVKKGDLADMSQPQVVTRKTAEGHYETEHGHVLKPARPVRFWAAVVASHTPTGEAIPLDAAGCVIPDAEGRILIDIPHPCGWRTQHYAVKYDAAKGLHTFHRQGD